MKLDGEPFMSQWIGGIGALDKQGRQTGKGEERVHKSGGGSTQSLPSGGKPSLFAPTIVGGSASASALNRNSETPRLALQMF